MPKKKTLASKLKGVKQKPRKKAYVWKGPEESGVTQSLLGRFLVCRERFRVLVVDGLRVADTFNHSIEYGSMWHECEEEYARTGGKHDEWRDALLTYTQKLCERYPLDREKIVHWYNVCKITFPIYVQYWKRRKDRKQSKSLLQEQVFEVPYELPSGRVVKLKGKWDGVDLVGSGGNAGVWLKEHKTKGQIDEEQIARQLTFDLQTMFYLIALKKVQESMDIGRHDDFPDIDVNLVSPIKGVIYNVVRRPLAGGKGSIRRHKATKTKDEETQEHYYDRLAAIIAEDPGEFFTGWDVAVTSSEIERFKREFLNPILEQLCDWWEWVSTPGEDPFIDSSSLVGPSQTGPHYRHPYGIYNTMLEGRTGDLDEYLATGSTVGLERVETLFKELE